MKQVKKIISLVLAFVMVMSVTAGIDFSALAADTDTDNKTVTSASFESSKGNDYLELIEGYSGSVENRDDGSYMIYYFQYDEGDKITLEFSDGTSDVYTFNCDDGSYSDGSESLNFYYNSDQSFDNQWTVGNSYKFTISIYDYDFDFDVDVHIVENPVKSIEYTTADDMTFTEGVGGQALADYYSYDYSEKMFSKGSVLTVNYTDGRKVNYTLGYYTDDDGADIPCFNGDDGEILEYQGNDYFEWYSNQDDAPWTVDNKECFAYLKYYGRKVKIPATIIENPVASISFAPSKAVEIYENTNGSWETEEEDDVKFYCYDSPISFYDEGNTLTVNYKDGKTKTYVSGYDSDYEGTLYSCADGDTISPHDLIYSDGQWAKHWTLGSDNYATISYCGKTATVPVTIKADPVASIEFEPAEPYEYTENTNGYDNGDGTFIYDVVNRQEGDKLILKLKDGTSSVYTRMDSDSDWQFENEDGDIINDDDVEFDNPQFDTPWGVGTHYFTVTYRSYTAKVKVVIKANPVASISFTPAEPIEIYENTKGSWEKENYSDEKFYCYGYTFSSLDSGNTLTVNYIDGTTKKYVSGYNEDIGEFAYTYSADGTTISPDDIQIYSYQYIKHWTLGSDNYVTVSYGGRNANVPVTIKESPIKSLSYTSGTPLTYYENCNGHYDNDSPDDERYFKYDFHDYYLFTKGSKLTVTYKDGKTKVYSVKGDDAYLSDDEGNDIDDGKSEFACLDDQYNVHWTKGSKNYVTMTFMGAETKIPVNIIESDVKSVKYNKAKPISIPENSSGRMDDDGNYYYYTDFEQSPFRAYENGDTMSISYKDGSSDTYTCVYDEDSGHEFFVNTKGEKLNWQYISSYDNQEEKPWTLGSDNYYYVSYQGVVAEVPVTIIENNVKSLDYKPVKPLKYYNNIGFWTSSTYRRDVFYINDGDILTVTYTDGSQKDFVAKQTYTDLGCGYKESRLSFVASDGEVLDNYYFGLNNLYDDDCEMNFEYYGKSTSVPVKCVNETSVTVTKKSPANIVAGDINADEDSDNAYWWVRTDDNGKKVIYYSLYPIYEDDEVKSNIFSVGDVITISYDDGTTVNYTYGGYGFEYGYRFYGDNNNVLYLETDFIMDNQETDHWTPDGDNYFQIKLGDVVSNKVNVNISGCKEHKYALSETVASTCTVKGHKLYTCTVCGKTYTEYLPLVAHKYQSTVTKATLSKNGSVVKKCTVCGDVESKSTIYSIKTVSLSASSYTYNGKAQKPTVTVKDSKGKTVSSKYYTVAYDKGNKSVGKYNVKVTFKGNYSGTKTLSYTILPKNTSISKLSAGKKSFKVSLKKYTTQTTGYELQYSTDKNFKKGTKTVTLKNTSTSATVKKLSAKKKYYVRVRTYKTVGKTKYYSSWSGAKSVTTKK